MPPNQKFSVREKLRRILQTVGATEKFFTTKQIFTYLGKYIEKKNLHDSSNMHIVRCKGDLLEDLFGVQEFTIDSFKNMWQFIFPHLIPATNKEVLRHESRCANKETPAPDAVDSSSGKVDIQWMSQLPWWYFVDKDSKVDDNHDVATASGSIVATSTAYVVDTDDESDSNPAINDSFEEDRFSVEYEPDSEDSDGDSDATEPVDSDDEDNNHFSPVPLPLPRLDYSEDTTTTTTTDTTDVSMDFDFPIEDHWRCRECSTVNPPTLSYCQRCWKLRKGWLDNSVGIIKSQTLPPKEYSEEFTPELLRSSTQPDFIRRGIDVIDGPMKKSSENQDERASSSNSGSNFSKLPFNINPVKRKLESSEDSPSTQFKKKSPSTLRNSMRDTTRVYEGQSSSSSSNQRLQYSPDITGLCNICHNNPNNATIVHGDYGHQYCCCKCAKKLKRKGMSCPVCRQPIELVIKNIICRM